MLSNIQLHKHLHLVVCLLFLLSCARQTSPTGGPKDTIPPKLINTNPKPEETNFKGRSVELTFSEPVQINSPKEQVIIIPGIGKDFDAITKKNKVIVTFDNPLSDTTTYLLNFRDAIQDMTEKNPAKNVQLAFSTGPYIDSLSISGIAFDALTVKPLKETTVAIFKQDTFNIFRHKATVFTKTDDKGKFKISNLKPGTYHLYAIQDNNKNLIIDSRSESYGFGLAPITLTVDSPNVKLPLTKLDARPLKITSARPNQTFFNIKASKNLDTYRIETPEGEPLLAAFGADHENVRIYNTAEVKDSLRLRFIGKDSLSQVVDTVVYAKFSDRQVKPEAFQIKTSSFLVSASKGLLTGSVIFNKPIVDINFDSIHYRIDSLNTIRFTKSDITFDTLNTTLKFSKAIPKNLLVKPEVPESQKPKPKPKPVAPPATEPRPKDKKATAPDKLAPLDYQLYLGKAAFIGAESDTSQAIAEVIKPSTLETTGMFHVEIKTQAVNYLVQVISKNVIARSVRSTPKVTFEDLPPGDYQIRLIIDTNNDGRWSPGNYFRKEPPETIVFYMNEKKTDVVNLKANFEIGPLLITY